MDALSFCAQYILAEPKFVERQVACSLARSFARAACIDCDARAKGPFYESLSSFRKWIGNVAGHLIVKADGPLKSLFDACRSSVKDQTETARYLLPYLVLRVACMQPVAEAVYRELCAVLRAADGAKSTDMAQLCAQTVFHLVDTLSHWVHEKRKLVLAAAPASRSASKSRRAKVSDESAAELPPEYAAGEMVVVVVLLRRR